MNYYGHALITGKHASGLKIFGSMAPDFVPMTGGHIVRNCPNVALGNGIDLHLLTDSLFDKNPLYTEITKKYFAIHQQFVPRGVSRAAARVGTDLLMDGFVLEYDEAIEAYQKAMITAQSTTVKIGQVATNPEEFEKAILLRDPYDIPYFYQDPIAVATILHSRIERLPSDRLKFDISLVPKIADVFINQQRDIGRIANRLIFETMYSLS